MKLTVKDKEFLEKLKRLIKEKQLQICLKKDIEKYFVLKGNYGDKIDREFGMTRQGVRWRFYRLFNEIYVSSFETILFIEKNFGTELRDKAIQIAQERYLARQAAKKTTFISGDKYRGKSKD